MSKLKYLLLLSVIFCRSSADAQLPNTWTQVADFGGSARSDGMSFSIDSFGYVLLGVTDSNQSLHPPVYPTDLWQYNPYTNVWRKKADFPGVGREGGISFVIGSKAYVGLGFNNTPVHFSDIWEYDPSIDTWTQKANFGGGQRYFASGISSTAYGYVGMGYSDTASEYKKDMWKYTPSTDSWTQLNDFPGPELSEWFMYCIDGFIYTGLGIDSAYNLVNDMWQYNPTSDTWTQLSSFPGAQISGAAFSFNIGSKGYMEVYYDSIPNIYNSPAYSNYFFEYDPSSDTWTKKDSFPGGMRQGCVSFTVGDRAYAGIGSPYLVQSCVKSFWMYTPDSINTGIHVIDADNISIYPIPANDRLYINGLTDEATFIVTDMTGRSVPAPLSGNELDVSALASGMYCLRIEIGGCSIVKKFVKE